MRPEILHPLFTSAETLPGVGAKLKGLLSRLVCDREQGALVKDVLFHLPTGVVDRREMPDLMTVQDGATITALVEVEEYHTPKAYSNQPFRIICRNETGYITLVFFRANINYLARELPVGSKRVVSGRVERFDGMLQMVHPDLILPESDLKKALKLEPVYPLTAGITNRLLTKIMQGALAKLPELGEWQEEVTGSRFKGDDKPKAETPNLKPETFKSALTRLHQPQEASDYGLDSPARKRLAYDELLANQLALALTRATVKQKAGRIIAGDGSLRRALEQQLPFALTAGQQEVVRDILADMASGYRMSRLLQGDVGSGKTVVALMAMLNAAEAAYQSALMAPTEILARQHYATISRMVEGLGVEVVLLTSREKGRQREEILAALASGQATIAVGTHALFQEGVQFHNLALAVIDEQHRFGVKQRIALSRKGEGTDILMLTATPIPRTLALTFYGDMEVSSLKEKPANRQPITTRVMPLMRELEIIEGLKRAVANGQRAYWVCPLIEGSEGADEEFSAVKARFAGLKSIFGKRAGLVHGQMKGEEKDAVMQAFKDGELDILVATTVIEVGVDVPEATIMVIEQAERFGLAQLHQLRGRVGRGAAASSCVLLYANQLSEAGKKRLMVLRETEDGFRIAEEDFLLRGSGEVLGTKQSGMARFTFAQFPEHSELLRQAREDVQSFIQTDPALASQRGKSLKTLLYLFEYDVQVQYLEG